MPELFRRVKDWASSITSFRTGDVILVDGTSGTAKMSKDDLLARTAENALGSIHSLSGTATDFASDDYIALDGATNASRKMKNDSLLKVTAQNALAGNVAPAFDPTRTNENPYLAGESVVYEGDVYVFVVDHYGAWNVADVIVNPNLSRSVQENTQAIKDISEYSWKSYTITETFQKVINDRGIIKDYPSGTYFAISNYIDVAGKTKVKVSCSSAYYGASCVFYNPDYSVNKIALQCNGNPIVTYTDEIIDVPSGAKYMLLARAAYAYTPILADYLDKYKPLDHDDFILVQAKVDDITEELYNSFSVNLIQKKIIKDSGVVIDFNNNNYWVTDYIDVENVTKVKVSGAANFYNSVCVFYNPDYSVNLIAISDTQGGSSWHDYSNVILSVPSGAKYMVVAGTSATGHNFPMAEYFQKYIVKKVWEGKKWCCIGDSLTERNIRTTKNYADYVSEETGIEIVNMGVSGTGYKRGYDSNNAFYQRISSVPLDSDVVTIFGSGNDNPYFSTENMGTATDTGTTTLGGCINTAIDNLYARLPAVHLGIVAPTPWGVYDPADHTNGMARYTELLKEICFNRSIPFLDLYHESNLRPWDSDFLPIAYSKDDGNSVHPDETGHKLLAGRFKVFVESIM